MKKQRIGIIMALLMIISLCAVLVSQTVRETQSEKIDNGKKTVIIDAGHGGTDPGKIGINGAYEKDINLEIAKKLAYYLECEDINVVMTRTDDEGLYSPNASNKKKEDMKCRCKIIEENASAITISIHQNSFPQGSAKGAQVFYYISSSESKELAGLVQNQLIDKLWKENTRQIKANSNYYILKRSITPTIIVECGFLSNPEEAKLLVTEEYQDRVAWAIHLGVINYLLKSS